MTPKYTAGDIVNGHVLTVHDDGRAEWIPVQATVSEPVEPASQPSYTAGDVVNGHVLTVRDDGRAEWVPVAPSIHSNSVVPKKSRRGLLIGLSIGGVLLLLIVVGGVGRALNGGATPDAGPPISDRDEDREPEPEFVDVPVGLVGMTAQDAVAALEAVGLNAEYDGEPTATVLSVDPSGSRVEAGTMITLTVEQPPALTLAQRNAVGKAEDYLRYSYFSRAGLIAQLEFEGFSTEDSTFAVDYLNPDWNAQAVGKAEDYLEYSSFSRQGLYDQLIFEGFTPDQAEAGLVGVGY